ncbi:MAG: hypothetical protein V3576_03735 [Candidatus Cloacimonadota bacterium]
MRQRLLLVLLTAVLLFLSACAERSTQWQDQEYVELDKVFPVVGDARDFDFDEDYIYAALDQGGMIIIDKATGSARWLTQVLKATGGYQALESVRTIAAMREFNLLFVNDIRATDGIYILNTSDPDSIKYFDAIVGATNSITEMKVYKIQNPTNNNRTEIAFTASRTFQFSSYDNHLWFGYDYGINAPAPCSGFDLTASHIFIAGQQRGLLIYNRADKTLVSDLAIPGEAQKVKVVGNYAYLVGRQGGLSVVDITNPASPVLLKNWDTSGYATSVDVRGNMAVVGSNSGGVYLFDISSPANPVLLQRITDCGFTNKVGFDGDSIIVATRDNGIRVYNIK